MWLLVGRCFGDLGTGFGKLVKMGIRCSNFFRCVLADDCRRGVCCRCEAQNADSSASISRHIGKYGLLRCSPSFRCNLTRTHYQDPRNHADALHHAIPASFHHHNKVDPHRSPSPQSTLQHSRSRPAPPQTPSNLSRRSLTTRH